MALVGSPRIRLAQELKREFPKMQKSEDIADVLLAGQDLGAVNDSNRKKKWEYVKKGAKGSTVYRAYKKYRLLEKRKSERRAFVMYMRGGSLKNDSDTRNALGRERRGLYAHLLASAAARTAVAESLSLPTNNLGLIQRTLERGTIAEQRNTYGKVVNHLTLKNLYDKRYDYYWMGFRFIADRYWLSKLALKLLSKAR
ncbi:MAG TPA: hypothetical protein VJ792_07270 [Candidatus Nitrosotalea sp.]|nr:hypothetical protein [Candidatus Nitrosotalea sp.]